MWLETSVAEEQIACDIAGRIVKRFAPQDIPRVIESLGVHLAGEKSRIAVHDLSRNSRTKLDSANFDNAFPRSQNDVSSNVFGRLAFKLRNALNGSIAEGAIATPYCLAEGIVRAAFFFRLQNEIPTVLHSRVREFLTGHVPLKAFSRPERLHLINVMRSLRWCDPCVGSGVFTLAVLSLASDLGLDPGDPANVRIEAWDTCPLSVSAARIRTALLVRSLTGRNVVEALRALPVHFHVGSSLNVLAESGELADGLHSFDLVVGNPPYVRSDVIPKSIKLELCTLFPSLAAKNHDLYFYFLAGAIFSLRRNGVVGFISSASFQRSRHGEAVRSLIAKHGRVRAVVDFGELRIFRDADVPYTSVYFVQKSPYSRKRRAKGILLRRMPQNSILELVAKSFDVPEENFSPTGWHISASPDQRLIECLSASGVPLTSIAGKTFSGIKTGCSRAYTIRSTAKTELEARGVSSARFRRLLLPTDIRQWAPEWSGHYLIIVGKDEVLDERDAIYSHLSEFRDELARRIDVKGHSTWYGLRACNYYPLLNKPKIVFPDISKAPRFAYDAEGFYIPDGAFFLSSSEISLVSVLNSAIATFYFRRTCNSIGHFSQGGRLRFKKTYVENFPVPPALLFDQDARARAGRFHSRLANSKVPRNERTELVIELNRFLLDAYNLPSTISQKLAKACGI
jgi:methylase of polypeptide subunit release factors